MTAEDSCLPAVGDGSRDIVFTLVPVRDDLPPATLRMSLAVTADSVEILAAYLGIPERAKDKVLSSHEFGEGAVVADYGKQGLHGIEITRLVRSPQQLPELWEFCEARDDHVLEAGVFFAMSQWLSIRVLILERKAAEIFERFRNVVKLSWYCKHGPGSRPAEMAAW